MNNDNTDYVSNESGTLSRLFKLPQHGTTVRTELIAGMTTFLTMVYIVFVNPQILGAAQMDPKVVFVTTCLIAGIGSIAMGIFANLPVALAPAMGLTPSLPSWSWGRWASPGRPGWAQYSGAQLDYFCSRCFVSGTG